jgi:hypothetical protein
MAPIIARATKQQEPEAEQSTRPAMGFVETKSPVICQLALVFVTQSAALGLMITTRVMPEARSCSGSFSNSTSNHDGRQNTRHWTSALTACCVQLPPSRWDHTA